LQDAPSASGSSAAPSAAGNCCAIVGNLTQSLTGGMSVNFDLCGKPGERNWYSDFERDAGLRAASLKRCERLVPSVAIIEMLRHKIPTDNARLCISCFSFARRQQRDEAGASALLGLLRTRGAGGSGSVHSDSDNDDADSDASGGAAGAVAPSLERLRERGAAAAAAIASPGRRSLASATRMRFARRALSAAPVDDIAARAALRPPTTSFMRNFQRNAAPVELPDLCGVPFEWAGAHAAGGGLVMPNVATGMDDVIGNGAGFRGLNAALAGVPRAATFTGVRGALFFSPIPIIMRFLNHPNTKNCENKANGLRSITASRSPHVHASFR